MSFRKGERVHYVNEREIGKVIGRGYAPELDEFGNEIRDNHGKPVTFDTGYIIVNFSNSVHWCDPAKLVKAAPGR